MWAFPGGSVVKNLPANAETGVRSHGWENPLEKEIPTHSSILAWEIPWTEESGGSPSTGSQKSCPYSKPSPVITSYQNYTLWKGKYQDLGNVTSNLTSNSEDTVEVNCTFSSHQH